MPENATWGVGRTGPPSRFQEGASKFFGKLFDAAEGVANLSQRGTNQLFARTRAIAQPIAEAVHGVGGAIRTVGVLGETMGGGKTFSRLADTGHEIMRGSVRQLGELDAAEMRATEMFSQKLQEIERASRVAQAATAWNLSAFDENQRLAIRTWSEDLLGRAWGLTREEVRSLKRQLAEEERIEQAPGLKRVPARKRSGRGKGKRYRRLQ